jgi:hypothetical protein
LELDVDDGETAKNMVERRMLLRHFHQEVVL